jgi:plasmid stabilization system protein ParE
VAELRIVYSAKARADLRALEEYIAERDGKSRARMILGRIEETIRILAFMPGMGRFRPYLREGLLAFSVTPWTIVYELQPELDGIRVIRVVDGRRDLESLLGSGP